MDRRTALGFIAAGAAGMAVPAARAADGATADGDTRVGIAVVGIGNYAGYALQQLHQASRARLAGLVSGDRAKARGIADGWRLPADAARTYAQFDRIADDERVEAVHICLPVGLHAEYAERALRAGKHVLCEKPLASTSRDARRLMALAQERGLVLMPAHRAWYSAPLQAALQRARELAPLVSIDAHKGFVMALPEGNWRFDPTLAGGGCLHDIGPYSLQLTRWAAGGLPLRVQARFGRADGDARFSHVEPHAAWIMELADGCIATGSASWRYHLQNSVRFGCAGGTVEMDPATPGAGERVRIALPEPSRIEEPSFPPRHQLPAMYDDFARAIREATAPQLTARDGLEDLLLIEAITAAARGGGTVEVERV